MTYNPSVPQPTDIPSQSQAQFSTNFTALNDIFDVNHVKYNDTATGDRGKHKYVTLTKQTETPAVVGSDAQFFTKNAGISTNAAPYYRNSALEYSIPVVIQAGNFTLAASSGTKNVIDMTAYPAMTGTVMAIQTNDRDRTLFSSFYWDGTALSIPGTAGQLASGSTLVRFDDDGDGTILQIQKASTSGTIQVNIRFFAVLI